VQVTRDDPAHVGAAQHLGQTVLVAQLDARREREDAGHRRVVHREDGPERRGRGEHPAQPRELIVAELAVVAAGDCRVERDHAQPVQLVHAVHGAEVGRLVQQRRTERGTVVVVAHDPQDARADPRGERLDEGTQPLVGEGFAEVDEVTGEDHGIGPHAAGLDDADRGRQMLLAVDRAEQLRRGRRAEVGVAQVEKDAFGGRVLGGAHG